MCNLKTVTWHAAKLSNNLDGHIGFLVAIFFCSLLKKKKGRNMCFFHIDKKIATIKNKTKNILIVGELHNFWWAALEYEFFINKKNWKPPIICKA